VSPVLSKQARTRFSVPFQWLLLFFAAVNRYCTHEINHSLHLPVRTRASWTEIIIRGGSRPEPVIHFPLRLCRRKRRRDRRRACGNSGQSPCRKTVSRAKRPADFGTIHFSRCSERGKNGTTTRRKMWGDTPGRINSTNYYDYYANVVDRRTILRKFVRNFTRFSVCVVVECKSFI